MIGMRKTRIGARVGPRFDGHQGITPVTLASWTIEKVSGLAGLFNAGAAAVDAVAGDTTLEATVDALGDKAFGLSGVANVGLGGIDAGFRLASNGVLSYTELGIAVPIGTYAPDDVLRIVRTGGTITYLKNGALVATSLGNYTAPLYANVSLASANTKIAGIRLYSGVTQVEIAWQGAVNVAITSS